MTQKNATVLKRILFTIFLSSLVMMCCVTYIFFYKVTTTITITPNIKLPLIDYPDTETADL